MRVSENLLPGKENALSAEYLVVKCHFSSVRMLQKAIEAERRDGFYPARRRLEAIIFRQRVMLRKSDVSSRHWRTEGRTH